MNQSLSQIQEPTHLTYHRHITSFAMVVVYGCLVLFLTASTGIAAIEGPTIKDPILRTAIESALGLFDPTPTDLLGLTELVVDRPSDLPGGIYDLTGLEYATNLQTLWLREHEFADISAVVGMLDLTVLHLSNSNISDISPLAGLTQLEYLDLHNNQIQDITPLKNLTQLETLILRYNDVFDLTPIGNMRNLQLLRLKSNQISDLAALASLNALHTLIITENTIHDISPLATLTSLQYLRANKNKIQDLTPLSQLGNIQEIDVFHNWIRDVSPLTDLTNLKYLDLRYNTLNESAYCNDLNQIYENNQNLALSYNYKQTAVNGLAASQGVHLHHVHLSWDPICNGPLYQTIYQVWRARVDQPAENRILINTCQALSQFDDYNVQPSIQYRYWIGTCPSIPNQNAKIFSEPTIGWSQERPILFVDPNGPNDPGPMDSNLSDPLEQGTLEHPFDGIQKAIDLAPPNATIHISTGVYQENLNIEGKSLLLTGRHPYEPNSMGFPVLTSSGRQPILRCTGIDDPILLEGVVLTSHAAVQVPVLEAWSAQLTLQNCLVAGHHTMEPNLAIIQGVESQIHLVNCTITDNSTAPDGACLRLLRSNLTITNSILWNNPPHVIAPLSEAEVTAAYSLIPSPWSGVDTFASDPLFADPGQWVTQPNGQLLWAMGDYHLRSTQGRWIPDTQTWSRDPLLSPGIDGGDPQDWPMYEVWPHGRRINLGVYGGTQEASLTPGY